MPIGSNLLSSSTSILSNANSINQTIDSALFNAKSASVINSVKKLEGSVDSKMKSGLENFEGMLISQLLGFMYDTVEVDENFGGGFAEEITRSLLLDKYGAIMAKSGGIGIADNIQKQLLRNQAAAGIKA